MKIISAIAILGALILIGCKAKKNAASTTNTNPTSHVRNTSNTGMPNGDTYTMLEFSKGMCFGKCPVYNIAINSDGTLEYTGKMHVDKLGTYSKNLSKTEFSTLFNDLKAMNLFQYENEYGGQIMDISQQKLTYREDGKEKNIICKLDYPDALIQLITRVDKIANSSGGWKLIKDLPNNPQNQVDNTVYDEVIVYIVKDLDINKWATDYKAYDLTVKKSLSPQGLIWLLGFNPSKIKGRELIMLLRADTDIKNSELNKKVEMRNR